MTDYLHRLNIMALLLVSPPALFLKINTLPWYRNALRDWADGLGYQAGDAVLEIGCATGQLAHYMARHGAHVAGADRSPKMLHKARTTESSSARFELASATSLPHADQCFDYVIAASLINIIPEPARAVSEIARVCKPGGKVSALVPHAGMTDKDMINLANSLSLRGFSREALMTWHRRAPKMRPETLSDYFSQAGLCPIRHETALGGMILTVTGIKMTLPAT